MFYFGAPLAFIFGAPLSGLLLDLHGALGLKGWQWLFLVESLLASMVGVWAFWYLDDDPAKARWLDASQRTLLLARLADDHRAASAHGPRDVLAAFVDPRVLVLYCVYFLIQAAVYGVVFYLPQQVAALLGTKVSLRVGLVTAIPWIAAVIVTWIVPRHADRTGRHLRVGLAVGAARRAAAVLDVSDPLSDRSGSGGRHRADQFARQILRADGQNAAEASFHSSGAGLMVLGGASLLAAAVIVLLVRMPERDSLAAGKPVRAS